MSAPANSLAEQLDAHGFSQIALSPGGKADIRVVERRERMALYLGTEGDGLPAGLLARLRNGAHSDRRRFRQPQCRRSFGDCAARDQEQRADSE